MEEEDRYEQDVFRLQPELRRKGPIDAVTQRDAGLRKVRHLSRWSAAALLVGVGAAAGELAHGFPPTGRSYAPIGTSANGTHASSNAPRLGHAAATSAGSTVAAGSGSGTNGSGATSGASASYQDS